MRLNVIETSMFKTGKLAAIIWVTDLTFNRQLRTEAEYTSDEVAPCLNTIRFNIIPDNLLFLLPKWPFFPFELSGQRATKLEGIPNERKISVQDSTAIIQATVQLWKH